MRAVKLADFGSHYRVAGVPPARTRGHLALAVFGIFAAETAAVRAGKMPATRSIGIQGRQ